MLQPEARNRSSCLGRALEAQDGAAIKVRLSRALATNSGVLTDASGLGSAQPAHPDNVSCNAFFRKHCRARHGDLQPTCQPRGELGVGFVVASHAA